MDDFNWHRSQHSPNWEVIEDAAERGAVDFGGGGGASDVGMVMTPEARVFDAVE